MKNNNNKRKFRRLEDDDPEWYENESFSAMTAQQRQAFRERKRKLRKIMLLQNSLLLLPLEQIEEKDKEEEKEASELLPIEIWSFIAEKVTDTFSNLVDSVTTLTNMASSCRLFSELLNDNCSLWKRIALRLEGGIEKWSECVCPVYDKGDTWKQLAFRHMPLNSHSCRSLCKKTLVKFMHIKEEWIPGKLHYTRKYNRKYWYNCTIVFKECAAKRLAGLYSEAIKQILLNNGKRNEAKALRIDTRNSKLIAAGIDSCSYYIDDLMYSYLCNGKNFKQLIECKRRKDSLCKSLLSNGLVPLCNPKLCTAYVRGEAHKTLDKVTKLSVEMDFLCEKTDYENLLRSEVRTMTKKNNNGEWVEGRRVDWDLRMRACSKNAKRAAYLGFLDKCPNDRTTLPDYVKIKIDKLLLKS